MSKKSASFALNDRQLAYVQRKVDSGEFSSADDVVQQAMQRYIAEDAKLAGLRRELQKGLDSGPAVEFDIDEWFEQEFGSE